MKRKLLVIVAIVTLVVVTLFPIASSNASTQYEKEFISLVNELRIGDSLNPLVENPDLSDASRIWAEHLASVGKISHDPNLATSLPAYKWLGENVGSGADVSSIFAALVASPGHLANMINSDFTEIGVGVAVSSNTLFAVQRFLDPVDNSVVTTTTAVPLPPIKTTQAPTTTQAEVIGKIVSPIYPKTPY